MTNIDQVFGNTLTRKQKTHWAKAFYSHLATSLKEMIRLRFMSDEALRASVEVRGHERMLDIVAQNRGVVLVLTGILAAGNLRRLAGWQISNNSKAISFYSQDVGK